MKETQKDRLTAGLIHDYLGNKALRMALFAYLAVKWLMVLRDSDAFFGPYILCAVTGVYALACNLRNEGPQAKRPVRDRVWIALFSACFSVFVTLANYRLLNPDQAHRLNIVWIVLGGYLIARNIIVWVLTRRTVVPAVRPAAKRRSPRTVFIVSFVCIASVYLLVLFFGSYPGNLTTDSLVQITQIVNHAYSNHHPFWHTMILKLCLDAGNLLFHDINSAVALYCVFQILCMSGVFAFLVMTLRQAGVSTGWLMAVTAGFMLLPYHIFYSVTLWKDVLFGGAAALYGCALYRSVKNIGRSATNWVTLILGALGFGLLRSNGWIAMFLTFVVSVFVLGRRRKKLLLVTAALLVVTFVLKGPFLKLLNVGQPDTVEYLSVPVQQISRVIVEEKELTDAEREQIEKIMEIDKVKALYQPHLSDPIKELIRNTDPDYLNEHKLDYLKLWIQLGLRYPGVYIEAWADQTKGYWNSGYDYWVVYDEVDENRFGIERSPQSGAVREAVLSWKQIFFGNGVFEPLFSIGLHVWIIMLAAAVTIIERRKECLIHISLLSIILTLMISTPVFSEFRYAYAVFTLFPFAALVTFSGAPAVNESEKA